MKILGLVGGIGSGKSTVAELMTQRDGVMVINADQLGHEVLRLSDVKTQIRFLWGEQPFGDDGEIDRRKLAGIVFSGTDEGNRNLESLIKISHPKIRELLQTRIELAKMDEKQLVLLDAPLLFEGKWDSFCDAVVFVDSPEQQRIERVLRRGWTLEEYHARVANQLPLDVKRNAAQFVIFNTGSIADLGNEIDGFLKRYL